MAQASPRRALRLPSDFLWGTAISGHQSEGGNTNSDSWVRENVRPTLFADRSGDACDSYHRYEEDIALAARLGFNCYRFGIEWSRIEPSEGFFSNAALDHYARVLEACSRRRLRPIVTYNHFTTPIWFAARGGFETPDSPDFFARYCERVTRHLGGLMHLATTFNEANIGLLVSLFPQTAGANAAVRAMMEAAARATGSPRFSSLAFADPAIASPLLQEAHRRGYAAIKAVRPDLSVGLTLTTQDIQALGDDSLADAYRARLYGDWLEVGRTHADFIGVQTYTRFRVDRHGVATPPQGAEMTDMGYEFYPQALANTVRWAHATFAKPIYITEMASPPTTTRAALPSSIRRSTGCAIASQRASLCTRICIGRCSIILSGPPDTGSISGSSQSTLKTFAARRSRAPTTWAPSPAPTGFEPRPVTLDCNRGLPASLPKIFTPE